MNRDLNDHQLLGLFSEVKFREDRNESVELNEIEFKEAFNGMIRIKKEKNLKSAKLDISSLAVHLIVFIVVFPLLLTFFFLGIKAFSVKGTIGSIITSLMTLGIYIYIYIYMELYSLGTAFGLTKKSQKDDEEEEEDLRKISDKDNEKEVGESEGDDNE